jgi:uncharacterized RDD family membrane protein YckC
MTNTTQSYAGLWVRVLAFAFDYLAIALYLVVITILSLTVTSAFPNLPRVLFGNPGSGQITGFFAITLPVTLYFALLESSAWQATWGKRRQRLKVIRTNGERLSRTRAVGRTVLKFIPWELAHTCIWQVSFAPQGPSPLITAGFALVWILVGANAISLLISKSHQTLYDQLAGTYVVTA